MTVHPGQVILDRVDFFELMYSIRTAEVATLEAQRVVQLAEAKKRQVYEAMATKYEFDPEKEWRFDVETLSLTEVVKD